MTAKILIVDDVAANTRLLTAKLKAEYYQVLSVSDGFTAIQQAILWQPDLILLDIMMPGMDGFECCQKLKFGEDTRHIPVIMLTALGEAFERVKGLEAGADDFLTKPVDYLTLMIRVRSLVRLKRVLDEWRARSDTAISFGVEQPNLGSEIGSNFKILVIDDLADNQDTIARCLGSSKMTFVASDESIQIALTSARLYDLILINLNTRSVDSLDMISKIRSESQTQHLPVLAVSDIFIDRRRLATAFDLGASDWVTFPIEIAELAVRCKNLIKKKLYQAKLQDHIDQTIQMVALDPLTGLYNRRYLNKHIQTLLMASEGIELSVLMVDIDHFKSINDRFGHVFGDSVIRMIANILVANTRAFDTVARYGGEEFVILLPGTSITEAVQIADRLIREVRSLQEKIDLPTKPILTISVGISANSSQNRLASDLLDAADKALYRAKYLGRNRLEVN